MPNSRAARADVLPVMHQSALKAAQREGLIRSTQGFAPNGRTAPVCP